MKVTYQRYLLALAVAGAALLAFTAQPTLGSQSAKQMQKQIEQNRAKRDQQYERIRELRKEKSGLTDVINGIDTKIEDKLSEIAQIQNHLETATTSLDEANARRDSLKTKLSSGKDTLGERVCAIYMLGDVGLVDVLFQASDFNDLLNRMFFIRTILENDQALIDDVQTQQNLLKSEMTTIEQRIADISTIKAQLDEQKEVLEGFKSMKQNDLEAIEQDEELSLRQIRELEEESKRMANRIRELSQTASAYKGKPWTGNFQKPVGGTITSGYGKRVHPVYGYTKMHTGVDISASTGTTIKAAGKGKVIYTGTQGGYGKCVIVDHGNNRTTLYAHMSRITCNAGDEVTTDSKLGEVGSTGISTGPHCHFEVRINGETVDPMSAMK